MSEKEPFYFSKELYDKLSKLGSGVSELARTVWKSHLMDYRELFIKPSLNINKKFNFHLFTIYVLSLFLLLSFL